MNGDEELLIGATDHITYASVEQDKDKSPATTNEEIRFIVKSSLPLVVTFLLQYLVSVLSVFAAGRLGAKELAAVSLAITTFNITGLAIYQGMATSLDSFCSQAYGAGMPHKVGLYFQRCSMIMVALTVVLLLPIWWFSGPIIKALVGDEELAMMCQTFLRILTFGAPGLLFFETGKRFLQAQHIFDATTYILLIVAPINFLLNWLLVWHPTYGLGFIGAPITLVIVYWLMPLMILGYVLFIDGKQCWGGLDSAAFKNWIPMLDLALPGVIMVEAEYLAFEVLTILAAKFGTDSLAAQSIGANVGSLIFQLPFAFAVTITTRIGHYVGRKDGKSAAKVTQIALVCAGIISIVDFLVVFFFRHTWSTVFTKDKNVTAISDMILMLVALNQLADGFNVAGAGILRGQGRQKVGSVLNMVSYYIIALPLGFLLAFHMKWEIKGLWIGLMTGVFFLALSQFLLVIFTNWDNVILESLRRHDH